MLHILPANVHSVTKPEMEIKGEKTSSERKEKNKIRNYSVVFS